MSKAQIEKRYGVFITVEEYYNPRRQRFMKDYKVYSADACLWDKGFRTLKGVEAMCKEDSKALLDIKNKVEEALRLKALRVQN